MRGTLDGGLSWLVVFGSFMSQFAVLGIHFVFGLLYIDLLKEFGQSKATTGENEFQSSGAPEFTAVCCIYSQFSRVKLLGHA